MSEAVGSTAENEDRKVVSKAGWKNNAQHVIVLPSGSVVKIRVPDLSLMIETGTIPQNLMDAALGVAMDPASKPTKELIAQQREFTDIVTLKTVVDPVLDEEDAKDIPYEDKEMLVAIATRQIDMDAEGSHIAGLDKSEKFRRFRRLGEFRPSLEDL